MSVHQSKDGRWFVHYRDKGTGKHRKESFGRGLNAETEARRRNDELGLRTWKRRTPKRKSPYFYELVNEFLAAKRIKVADTTFQNWLWKFDGVILPELSHLPAIQITAAKLDQYVEKRQSDDVKNTTIHRELSDVQTVLNWAARPERRFISVNPVAGYQKPKRDDAIIHPPSPQEVRRILDHSAPHLYRAIVFSYYTGVRPGAIELFSRRWHHVDFDAKGVMLESARKGGLRYRFVYLKPEFLTSLNEWYEKDGRNPEYPIIHYCGQPIKSIKTAWRSAKARAGIKRRIRPYDCRHAIATELLRNRADLKTVSELLGHGRTDTTTRIYQHTSAEMHRAAVGLLPALLDEDPDKWISLPQDTLECTLEKRNI